jgi:hypothetical protein
MNENHFLHLGSLKRHAQQYKNGAAPAVLHPKYNVILGKVNHNTRDTTPKYNVILEKANRASAPK